MPSRPLALVSGASRGIGREVALRLAERGFHVLAGVRDPAKAPAAEHLEPLRLDVASEASVRAAAEMVRARFQRLDLLVNNAGILLDWEGSILTVDGDTLHRTLETNTLGPLRLAQALAPLMPSGSRIVNVSSGGGQLSAPATWGPAYCISKTALNAVTVQLAAALQSQGVAVNSVCPGWVRTDMGGSGATRSVAEGAAGILWLATEAPAHLTGGFFRDGRPIPW